MLIGFLLLAAAPATAPEHFFVGRTEGAGTVQMIMSGSHKVRDHSRGRLDKSGALILEQIVEEEGKPARRRSWRLVRAGGNRITGTISDAIGPVSGRIRGNVLHPWFVGVQFHPELKSKPFDPHPLFASFIEAAVKQSRLV